MASSAVLGCVHLPVLHGKPESFCVRTDLRASRRPLRRHSVISAGASVRCESSTDSVDAEVKRGCIGLLKSTAIGVAASVLMFSGASFLPALADEEFKIYYGTAASASSYGGYGGNADRQATAEYIYDVPVGWKERAISKVEKGTNGTDSEFYNPKRKTEKVYVTFLAGFRKLAPQETVLGDLALSDVSLQDSLAGADKITQSRHEVNGQMYYDYEIDSPFSHQLISVTCTKNKLYAHFVTAPASEWKSDSDVLKRIHASFKTVGRDPLEKAFS